MHSLFAHQTLPLLVSLPHRAASAIPKVSFVIPLDVGECISQACRELVAPLSLLQGYTEWLRHGIVPAESGLSRCLPVMERSIIRLTKVIEDMNCLAMIASDHAVSSASSLLNFKALAEKVVAQSETLAEVHGAVLNTDTIGADVLINGDFFLWDYCLTTFLELLLAAGSGRSSVICITCETTSGYRVIRISDNIGLISEEDYHQLESGLLTIQGLLGSEVNCTGLSLRATRQALLTQKASMELRSIPGTSTTIIVRAPLV
jgi:signal transduction histidine kinase